MLRKGLIVLAALAFVLTFFVWAENEIAQSFQTCISEKAAKEPTERPHNQSNSVAVIIKTQALCSLRLVDAHNGFFSTLAAVAVAAFTFTLWVATDQLAKSGQRIFEATERAFVLLDGFDYELTTDTKGRISHNLLPAFYLGKSHLFLTRFAMRPRWRNGGNTPTKKMLVKINWQGPPGPILPTHEYKNDSAEPFFLAPKAVEGTPFLEMPVARALVDHGMGGLGLPPRIFIWGRADYEDIFGNPHFIEWCHELRLEAHDGDNLRAGTTQWGEYNRTDEDQA
jgi:hypothetical protein